MKTYWFAVLLLLGALVPAACGKVANADSTLNTERATAALTAKMRAAIPRFRFIDGMAASSDPDESGVYAVLARDGVLEPYVAPSTLQPKPELHYRLTRKGRRLARGWQRYTNGDYEAAIGAYRLEAVDTVETLASGYAMVTYRYSVVLNETGRMLYESRVPNLRYFDELSSRLNAVRRAMAASSGMAELTLRDEGWTAE